MKDNESENPLNWDMGKVHAELVASVMEMNDPMSLVSLMVVLLGAVELKRGHEAVHAIIELVVHSFEAGIGKDLVLEMMTGVTG